MKNARNLKFRNLTAVHRRGKWISWIWPIGLRTGYGRQKVESRPSRVAQSPTGAVLTSIIVVHMFNRFPVLRNVCADPFQAKEWRSHASYLTAKNFDGRENFLSFLGAIRPIKTFATSYLNMPNKLRVIMPQLPKNSNFSFFKDWKIIVFPCSVVFYSCLEIKNVVSTKK